MDEKTIARFWAKVDRRGPTYVGYMYGVTHCTIGLVVRRRTWRHVP